MSAKKVSAICFSNIGKRDNYEDNFYINGKYLTSALQQQMLDSHFCYVEDTTSFGVTLYALSDGIGGHNAGEVASRICVEKLAMAYEKIQHYSSLKEIVMYLQLVIAKINQEVHDLGCKKNDFKGMGATLVILVMYGNECAILNVGDSRAYHYFNGTIVQITKDHTEEQRMVDLGLLTRKELFEFPARKNLNRYIGYFQNGYVLQADEYYFTLEKGMILLCSDGVSDFISDTKISKILSSEKNFKIAGKHLIDEAVKSHKADNATLILISFRR